MPIRLVTGSPGHGKSQYAIDYVIQVAEAENRPVYYTNVDGITMEGWQQFDPMAIETTEKNVHRYQGVPDGALILMDEASYIFHQRKGSEDAPPQEKILTTHRHAGYDIVIVTQHPRDIPAYTRRRVEDHYHLKRKKKKNVALLYHWSEGEIGDIDDGAVKNAHRAQRSLYKYKPEIWGKYKSTTINTVKADRWPWKVWVFPVLIVVMLVLVYNVYQFFFAGGLSGVDADLSQPSTSRYTGPKTGSENDSLPTAEERQKTRAAKGLEYVDDRLQVVEGDPQSEPRFIEVNKVKSFPRPQCVLFNHKPLPELVEGREEVDRSPVKGVCRCYSQQATRLDVDDHYCRDIVRYGYFEAARDDDALNPSDNQARERRASLVDAGAAPIGPRTPGAATITRVRSTEWWNDGGGEDAREWAREQDEAMRERSANR